MFMTNISGFAVAKQQRNFLLCVFNFKKKPTAWTIQSVEF